ncbi:MAG TPA: TPM domain-containing protein [Novosphingobium sp.]|nr:TPM domain-containing protein [Novosphingobium sp.]
MRRLIAWLVLLAALAASPARAVSYPPAPDGPVLDQAGLIPDAQEAALDARLREYAQRTGRVIVIATVPSLEGETIEIYAVKLFEAWGIGGKESDQGLLLLVAPNERKVRIEVGYGLHQFVTDALSGRIIRNAITPRFREGDMAGGIEAGVSELIAQLDRTPEDAKAIAEAAAAAEAQQGGGEATIGGAIFWIFLILFFVFVFHGGGRRRARPGFNDPAIILWGASEIARHMASGSGRSSGGFGGGGGGFGGGGSGGGGASGSW